MSGYSFYIAARGSLAYVPRVRALALQLTARGHRWTHDWTQDLEDAYSRGIKSDRDLPPDAQVAIAKKDRDGVRLADALVFLSPQADERSEGAAYELGLHHGRSMSRPGFSIVVGKPNCIFALLSDYIVSEDAEVLKVFQQHGLGSLFIP